MADDAVVVLWLSQWNRYALIQELQEVFRHPYEALSPELAATYDRLKPRDFFSAGGCRTTAVRPEPRLAEDAQYGVRGERAGGPALGLLWRKPAMGSV